METFLTDALKEKYKQLADRCRAVLFSAPCGFGKSCAARALAGPGRTVTLSAREPGFSLPRLLLKTRGSKSYLSFDHDVTFCEASAWCKRADYPFRHSSWKDMTLSVNLDLN